MPTCWHHEPITETSALFLSLNGLTVTVVEVFYRMKETLKCIKETKMKVKNEDNSAVASEKGMFTNFYSHKKFNLCRTSKV